MRALSKTLMLALCGGVALHSLPLRAAAPEEPPVPEAMADEAAEAAPKAKPKARAKGKRKEEGVWKFRIDDLRVSAGAYVDDPAPSSSLDLMAAASARMQSGPWEFALGARADGQHQGGSPDFSRAKLDYAENYVRWRGEETRLTVGAQNVLWGRVDEISPIDRMSRVDLTRLVLDEQPERRRAVPAVRLERFMGDYKLDAVWLPVFDAAVMPHRHSAWYPVDTVAGRVVGIGALPIAGFRVRDEASGAGGGGVRLTRAGSGLDFGLSVQRARLSLPYYKLGPGVLTGVHPYTWVVGGELETQRAGATWRMEAAWSSDVPVTDPLGRLGFETGWDVVVGAEFFPGDAETRVTLQLAGHETTANGPILDRDRWRAFTGEVEHPFGQGRWRFNLRFSAGLGDRDVYLNPRIAYLGMDRHEFFLAAHVFSGEDKTVGGFYEGKDLIELGWRARF